MSAALKMSFHLGWLAALAIAGATTTAAVNSPEPTDAAAQLQLARAFLSGNGQTKDPVKALEWMRKAAAQGHPDALGGVGYFYARGVAVPEDDAVAVDWFRKGAEKGSAASQLNLGLAIANGRGVAPDPMEGLRWIDAAAAQNFPAALYAQGESFHFGQFGRAIDAAKALGCFRAAAEAGHSDAQCNLGLMLRDGVGAAKDEEAALRWFRRAAEAGHAKSQSNLGHALGVESADRKRRIEALKWVSLAAEQGEITAVKTLEELVPNLPTDLLAEVRHALAGWQTAPPVQPAK